MKYINVIMGPTFSGKNTYLMKRLCDIPQSHLVIAHTTRPPRKDEIDCFDYYFENKYCDFDTNICIRSYMSAFNTRWIYWLNKNDIIDNRVNFAILDYAGFDELYNLYKDDKDTDVIGLYLNTPLPIIKDRIKNSRRRDENLKETFRRLDDDCQKFKNIQNDDRVIMIDKY